MFARHFAIPIWYGVHDIPNIFLLLTRNPLKMLFWDGTKEEATSENVTIGHENTGIVVEVGRNAKGFEVGDKVGCLGCSYACCKSP